MNFEYGDIVYWVDVDFYGYVARERVSNPKGIGVVPVPLGLNYEVKKGVVINNDNLVMDWVTVHCHSGNYSEDINIRRLFDICSEAIEAAKKQLTFDVSIFQKDCETDETKREEKKTS